MPVRLFAEVSLKAIDECAKTYAMRLSKGRNEITFKANDVKVRIKVTVIVRVRVAIKVFKYSNVFPAVASARYPYTYIGLYSSNGFVCSCLINADAFMKFSCLATLSRTMIMAYILCLIAADTKSEN